MYQQQGVLHLPPSRLRLYLGLEKYHRLEV